MALVRRQRSGPSANFVEGPQRVGSVSSPPNTAVAQAPSMCIFARGVAFKLRKQPLSSAIDAWPMTATCQTPSIDTTERTGGDAARFVGIRNA